MILTKTDGVALGLRRYSNSRPTVRQTSFNGLPINIEFDKGETKTGIGQYGQVWKKEFAVPYGEIDGTLSPYDGDPLDVFLGDDGQTDVVYIVHEMGRDGKVRQDKVMLGFPDRASAESCYVAHGLPNGLGPVETLTWDQFVNGYLAGVRII